MIWRISAVSLFLLTLTTVSRAEESIQKSTVWLTKPQSRAAERQPNAKRFPEAVCPTQRDDNDAKTQLQSGAIVEIQWQQTTADDQHVGGNFAKIELLAAESNNILARLDTVGANSASENGAMSKLVRIPENFNCRECTLRLTVDFDAKSQVISCADVQIMPKNQTSSHIDCFSNEDCGGGECFRNVCYCSAGSYGPHCANESHYTSQLATVVESSNYHALTFPTQGKFLWRIDREQNAIEMALRVPHIKSADTNSVTWYALGVRPEDEASKAKCIRMMTVSGNRAQGVPVRADAAHSENSVQVESPSIGVVPVGPVKSDASKKNLNIKKITNSATTNEPSCGNNEQWSTCPEFSRECEPSCDWTAFPESIPSCPKACGEPRCVCSEGYVRVANDNNECRPFEYCQASEVVTEECPRNETLAKCGTACEPSCETMYNVDPCTATCQKPACTCADNYVRFNGECIFWANCPYLEERFLSSTGNGVPSVIGNEASKPTAPKRTSVVPTFTGDAETSTPKMESAFVTDQSPGAVTIDGIGALQCAINETVNECGRVCEVDCLTIFERGDCSECDVRPMCACKQGFARHADGHCIYWNDCPIPKPMPEILAAAITTTTKQPSSKSTTQLNIIQTTGEKAETTKARVKLNKTTATIPTVVDTATTTPSASLESAPVVLHDCFGEWAWPSRCAKDCDYKISWIYEPDTDFIDFALEARLSANLWSGIGFAPRAGEETSEDWIVVKSGNGDELTLHDMHVKPDGNLSEDVIQNVFSTDAKLNTHTNGLLRVTFTRARVNVSSPDADDASFAEGHCHKMLFPVSGGHILEDGTIASVLSPTHSTIHEICIRECPQKKPKETTAKSITDVETIATVPKVAEKFTTTASKTESEKSKPTYTCQTEYRYPENCAADMCEYKARWMLDPLRGDVEFEVSARGIGRWTGIGFSMDGQMVNADMYIGWVYDHRAYVTDRFSADRQVPIIDALNDIYNVSGRLHDDVQTISFRRKVVTADKTTDFPLDRCWHYLFPVGGGRVMARQGDDFRNADTPIGFHDQAPPEFSARRVCLCVDGVPLDSDVPSVANVLRDNTPVVSAKIAEAIVHSAQRRAKRQLAASETAADDAFVCSDVAVVELHGDTKIHVSDAFALSKRAVQSDVFSFSDISAQLEGDTLTVLMRKPLNESDINDFSLADGPATVYVVSGQNAVDLSAAPVELMRVNLIHPEKHASTSPEEPTSSDGTTESVSSAATNVVDEFSSPNNDGPFDVSSVSINTPTTTFGRDAMTSSVDLDTTTLSIKKWTTSWGAVTNDVTTTSTDKAVITMSSTSEATTTTSTETETTPSTTVQSTAQFMQTTERSQPTESHQTHSSSIEQSKQLSSNENCYGAFAFPESCAPGTCQYAVQWVVNSVKKSVDFQLSAETRTERWTGIGFSPDGAMADADVVIVSVQADSSVTVMDQFSFGYGRPRVDKIQDVFNVESVYRDGRVHTNFSRNLQTGDTADDVDLLSRCYRFIFLQSGGALEGGSGEIRKHLETPIVSRNKICLGKCELIEELMTPSADANTTTVASTPVTKENLVPKRVDVPEKKKENTVEVMRAGVESNDGTPAVAIPPSKPPLSNRLYDVVVRLTGEKWSADLLDATSERFSKVSAKIVNAFKPALASRWPILKEVRVSNFAEGVMSLLQIEFNPGEAPGEEELRDFLRELVASSDSSNSAAAALNIDADTMKVQENTSVDLEDKWGPLHELGSWLIVGVVLAVCAIICALCISCICRRRRSSREKRNKSMHSFSPHYAYQYSGSAYPTGITNAAYVGGLPSSKDTDVTKITGGSSTASSSTNGNKSADKSPRTPKVGASTRYNVSEPSSLMNFNGGTTRACPRGIGETTYQEWFAKVASKDAPSHYQESTYATPPICRQLGGGGALAYSPAAVHHPPQPQQHQQSYVTYPNDPGSYYTMNGEHKLPPPSHYHRH